ncbi:MAG: hypothetical protein GY705_23725 [Bacteroidetes bacterium]|nr:hypothetical protein [Bacteroidota bacterium]
MKSLRFVLFFALIFGLLIPACTKESQDNLTDDGVFVDSSLQPYFDSFEYEASLRGLDINLLEAGVEGYIENIEDDGVIGQCQSGSGRRILIDDQYWKRASSMQRESVIFHELGHCYLQRDHSDDSYSNGTCVSIMRSGTGNCKFVYNTLTKEKYLDELFSQ